MIPYIILTIEDDDERAFMEDLYISYERLMYSEINKLLKNSWDTSDVLHTVVINLIKNISTLRGMERPQLVSYIVKAARYTALNYLRDKKKITEFPFDEEHDVLKDEYVSFDDQMQHAELIRAAREAWKTLDMRSRRILDLKYMQKKSNKEIAREFGMSTDSVRMALTRARNKLKEKMKDTEMV